MLKKFTRLWQRILIHLFIILSVVILFECFVGNYKHFLAMPDDEINYNVDSLRLYGLEYDEAKNSYIATTNNPYFEIKDINKKVKTIYLDANNLDPKESILTIKVEYTDETKPTYTWYSKPIEVVRGYENSKYLQEDFFGATEKLRFTFKIDRGEEISFNEISLNKTIPFHFSFVRVVALLILILIIYFPAILYKYRDAIESRKIRLGVRIASVLIPITLALVIFGDIINGFSNGLLINGGSQLSKELVDAFMHGQVSLLTKPSDALLELENPYILENRYGIDYLWDHLLFEGKYYSYYGITPVFLLFLPTKLITGYYFNDMYAVLLFTIISIIFLALTYYSILDRRENKLPIGLEASGFIILFMACGALNNIIRPAFYEVSTSCAFMCMTIALYHLVKSNALRKENEISFYHLTFHTFWLSLAVLSRATYGLYAICSVIILAFAFFERYKGYNKVKITKFLLSSLLPYLIFGSVQMTYNYLRFGNILDFGIEYSLTINDFTNTEFHPSLAFTSLYNFLFAVPKISDSNYFINPYTLDFGASGYYFFETHDAIGLFTRVPILYMIFIMPFLKSDKTLKEKLVYTLKYVLPCIIVPVILVLLTWESGFANRYYSDFAWAMVLFILINFFNIYDRGVKNNDNTLLLVITVLITVCVITSFIGVMGQVNYYIPNFTHRTGVINYAYTDMYYQKARELAFWR